MMIECDMCSKAIEQKESNNAEPLIPKGRCCHDCNGLVILYRIWPDKFKELMKKWADKEKADYQEYLDKHGEMEIDMNSKEFKESYQKCVDIMNKYKKTD